MIRITGLNAKVFKESLESRTRKEVADNNGMTATNVRRHEERVLAVLRRHGFFYYDIKEAREHKDKIVSFIENLISCPCCNGIGYVDQRTLKG